MSSSSNNHSFLHSPAFGGILLFASALIAFVWANTSPDSYHHFWHDTVWRTGSGTGKLWEVDLHHIVNELLMAVFFFFTGLEIKKEIVAGQLSSFNKAILPLGAAFGGMVVPALLFYFFNSGFESQRGWGVPMATDIAFSLGVLALLGSRVSLSLKVFLTALAIGDDLGAVTVIATYYTDYINMYELLFGLGGIVVLLVANIAGVRNRLFYITIGLFALWISFVESGVHATIAGVLLAFVIPAKPKIDHKTYIEKARFYLKKLEESDAKVTKGVQDDNIVDTIDSMKKLSFDAVNPSQLREKTLHPIVTFIIMPVFALANAGVYIEGDVLEMLKSPVSVGIAAGLILGKPIGVFVVTKLFVLLKIGSLPVDINWTQIVGIGFLAGMGFTMSLFVSDLAFTDVDIQIASKTSVMISSLISGLIGFLILYFDSMKSKT